LWIIHKQTVNLSEKLLLIVHTLYVGVAVHGAPQDGLDWRFLFVETLRFGVCFGVAYAFFSTCDT
jgi:hypothetical protein